PYRLAKFRTDCRGDVTTIIAKALEQDPEKRYQTADEFAADLRRLLAREPIHARPVSLRERAWLFCRRKPLLCALVAVMLLVVLALAVGGPLLAASFRAARLRAETSQQRAERREGESRELLEYLGRVSADELQGKEGVGELRTKMLKKVLSYHQKFVKEQQSSSNMLQLADAHFEIGYLSNSLGDVQEAKRAYEQALSILDRLAVERANVQARKKRAETFHNLANVQMSLRDYDDALRCLSHAVSQWEELSHDEPGNLEYVQGVVMALNVRAMVFRAQGDYDSALRIYEASVSRHEAWLSEDPDNGAHRHNLWMLLGNLGNLYDDLDRFADARRAFERALEESRRLYEAGPSCASRIRLAESHASLALVLGHLGIVDECLANFGKAVEIHREVVRDFPGDPGNRVNLSRALHNMSCRLLRHDRLQEAMGPLEEAIRERRQLVLVQPDNLGWRLNLANSLGELGTAHHLMGDHDRAREEYEETLAILTELVDAAPNDLESRRRRSATHLFMAKLLLEMNDAVAALQQLEDGLHQQEHVADAAFLADDHDRVAELHRWKGMALAALGRKEEALAAYQTAAELWQRIGGHGHVVTARALAACISLAPDETAVEQFAQRALDALRRAVAQNAVDLETLDTDPDLAPLRKRAEYEAIRGAVTAKQ
ncbi:MAG: tetratricopeptide repeat protein, partial [Planctomycetes bacterium]|nr:tetratricopeptide repeat protein [Planctomycetota bacterium]